MNNDAKKPTVPRPPLPDNLNRATESFKEPTRTSTVTVSNTLPAPPNPQNNDNGGQKKGK